MMDAVGFLRNVSTFLPDQKAELFVFFAVVISNLKYRLILPGFLLTKEIHFQQPKRMKLTHGELSR
jgi:hypothetical protein